MFRPGVGAAARIYFSGWLATLPSRSVTIHIAVASDKPQPLIESICRLPRWPRSEFNCSSTQPYCPENRVLAQGLAHATPSDRLIHHHVLDPGPHASRDSEDDKRQQTDDPPIVPGVPRDQDRVGLGLDNLAYQVWGRHERHFATAAGSDG